MATWKCLLILASWWHFWRLKLLRQKHNKLLLELQNLELKGKRIFCIDYGRESTYPGRCPTWYPKIEKELMREVTFENKHSFFPEVTLSENFSRIRRIASKSNKTSDEMKGYDWCQVKGNYCILARGDIEVQKEAKILFRTDDWGN